MSRTMKTPDVINSDFPQNDLVITAAIQWAVTAQALLTTSCHLTMETHSSKTFIYL